MANNLENRDAYLIIGVEDGTGEIVGVEKDPNRRNQTGIIDFLSNKKFAGDMRPEIELITLNIDKHKLDVIIIKNSTNTPYFLKDKFCDGNKTVRANNIYIRVGNANTAIDKTADINKIEYLWRKRFGIDLHPLERAKILLKNSKDWLPMGTDGTHSTDLYKYRGVWYNKHNPEYTLKYKKDTTRFNKGKIDDGIESDMYWLNTLPKPFHHTYCYTLELKYHSTALFNTLAVLAGIYKFERTMWRTNLLFENQSNIYIKYCYIEKNSLEFLLDEWIVNKQETVEKTLALDIHSSLEQSLLHRGEFNPYSVVPVFKDVREHEAFISYVRTYKTDFLDEVGDFNLESSQYTGMQAADLDYIEYLCKTGETLVCWLNKWRITVGCN